MSTSTGFFVRNISENPDSTLRIDVDGDALAYVEALRVQRVIDEPDDTYCSNCSERVGVVTGDGPEPTTFVPFLVTGIRVFCEECMLPWT